MSARFSILVTMALAALPLATIQGFQAPQSSAAGSSTATAAASAPRALVDKYCVTCHNQKLKTAGIMFDKMDLGQVPENAETWEKVIRRVRGGMMPPQGMPRPDQATLDGFASWLETTIDTAAKNKRNPGTIAAHRMNRTEYANAVRDLLGIQVDSTALLPTDDTDGFDNMAAVLKISPSFLEQYISAADQVSGLAVGDPSAPPLTKVYRPPADLSQLQHVEGLPLGTRGGFSVQHYFPLDGDYKFNIGLHRSAIYLPGLEFAYRVVMTIDNAKVFDGPLGGDADLEAQDHGLAAATEKIMARFRNIHLKVKAGPHTVGVTFLDRDLAQLDEVLQPFTREITSSQLKASGIQNGIPTIDRLDVVGPYQATGPGDTPSRRRIFVCHPATTGDEVACAKKIVMALEKKAFRRPVTDADIETSLSFYQKARNRGGNFEAGIENALVYILASPKFLYRNEIDPPESVPGTVRPISDLELASRLSFFLWSTLPDDELLNVAIQGKLKDPAMLRREVIRMVADPKAEALNKNFALQWLNVRSIDGIDPDMDEFANFDDNLRQAMVKETELFFGSIVREDRNVMDLLSANYTFVNERLALHYGIPDIQGDQFRRITLSDPQRWGLLGKGSVLLVTSYANRTSPVLRGKWILENILGTPPPSPPPNVPALKENIAGEKPQSVRALLEAHRANPTCATCHRVMDPLGFSLERFDAIGAARVSDHGNAIDSSGQLADGTKVNGPQELREALMKHPNQFAGTLTEKLMTYALGRGVEYYDMPTVREIVHQAAANNYRFSSIVMGIVQSAAFQSRKVPENSGQKLASVHQ